MYEILCGDCREVMAGMKDNSIDSIVTDPPYGLSKEPDITEVLLHWLAGDEYRHNSKGFMGNTWDSFVPGPEYWRECYRVLKPGGYLLCFASSRTSDLMGISLRLAGFLSLPIIGWVTGQGFPKGANLSKQLDKSAGVSRKIVGSAKGAGSDKTNSPGTYNRDYNDTAPATDAAKKWDGWYYGKQSLKPSLEPILLSQKPHEGRMVDNVIKYGTGAINIDGCRIKSEEYTINTWDNGAQPFGGGAGKPYSGRSRSGRWPANLIHDSSDEVIALFPVTAPSKRANRGKGIDGPTFKNANGEKDGIRGHDDSGGSAARYFASFPPDPIIYHPKANKKDRDEGLENEPIANREKRTDTGAGSFTEKGVQPGRNPHSTVKPTGLMRYLVRLITPPEGVVLDPFVGSGSTVKAAVLEGFNAIGIEQNEEYARIAELRVSAVIDKTKDVDGQQMKMFDN